MGWINVAALEGAVDVMRDITGSEDVNIWGSCSGGITVAALLANLAARGEQKIHSATVAVCLLDMAVAEDTTAGIFVTPRNRSLPQRPRSVANDPVGSGLVASLSRPGGNVTGLSFQAPESAGKRLELLHQLVPMWLDF